MIIRSKAPLRLGLAGGGSDVSPYSDLFGGATLNATINKFAYATLIPHTDGKIILNSVDRKKLVSLKENDKEFQTTTKNVYVVGKDKADIEAIQSK